MNLLSSLPDARTAEQTETLLTRPGMRVGRIVSLGQTSPPGFWYNQPQGEWVLVLAGADANACKRGARSWNGTDLAILI